MTMIRLLMLFVLAPFTIAVVDLLILIPLALVMIEVIYILALGKHIQEALEVVTGIGVILIGWGVALEERHDLREIFNIHTHNEEWQSGIDFSCKSTGIGALVFGLFAEMCIEAIKLPNHIINTEGLNEGVVALSMVFLALTAYILIRHIVLLVPAALRRRLPPPKDA
jgi:hypothetical protein